MNVEQKISDEIRETAEKILRYTDPLDACNVHLQDMDAYQLARVLTRLKVVEKIMLDVWEAME